MKRTDNKGKKAGYPLTPYLVGLFITVVVLVLLSYLVQLRNKQELNLSVPSDYYISQSIVAEL